MKTGAFLGIDTSNYRTSAAILKGDGEYISRRRLLDAGKSLGLRQSEALFLHIRDIPEIITDVFSQFNGSINSVGVSVRPRDAKGSYMPCFLAGAAAAKSAAAALGVPCYEFSHQAGHIAAALLSSNKLDLVGKEFIAFHISGGTTEALLVTPQADTVFNCKIIGGTTDLKIGQAVDRLGKLYGLTFPSGAELDRLSENGTLPEKVKISLKGAYCSISGLENKCKRFKENGVPVGDAAAYAFEYIAETLAATVRELRCEYGSIPIVFAGGVTANTVIRNRLSGQDNIFFASPELSGDNAVGTAVLAAIKEGAAF